jgi:predicted MFS family arabinose efflux permease/ribosomal protein S18 acetylase RimI-like enzyme
MAGGPISLAPTLPSGRGALRLRSGSPSVVLFLALFASQSGVLVLSPILSEIADEFDVSIASAGQLRILAAPLAAVVALVAARALVRVSPRTLLGAGGGLVALGAAASAASPSFMLLALAQAPLWAGISLLLTAAIAASAAWTAPEGRTRVVAHMFAGPPTAWIVGMPIIGLVAEVDWRLAFLALPLPAGLLALLAAATRPGDAPIPGAGGSLRDLLRRPVTRRWVAGELLATSAWAGTLVFSGALLTEEYGMSTTATGVALAAVAVAYLLGNRRAGRGEAGRARRSMLLTSVAGAAAVALMWAFTPTAAVTLALFAVSGAMVATRTVSATVYGFSVAGELGREVGAARAVTTQAGYLIGSLVGGAALAVGGFPLLALALGGLLLASTLPYASVLMQRRRDGRELPQAHPQAVSGSVTMPTRALGLRHGRTLLVRPLRDGDAATVLAVFERLGERSRRARFNGPKPQLSPAELAQLSVVDATRHVLVGYLEGDPRPVAIARLVRDDATAEIAFEVADELHRLGIGSALTAELLADARAAGITEVTALVASDNTPAMSLLRRVLGRFDVQFDGPELAIRAVLA